MKIEKYAEMSAEEVFAYLEKLAKKSGTDVRGLAAKAGMERINAWRWESKEVKPTFGNVLRLEQAANNE